MTKSYFKHALICAMLFATNTYAQSVVTQADKLVPPSPEAAALGKYAAIPVSLYTGTPEISIPIWTIQEGSIQVPVSLSYHASGNKVDEIASRVGLGWVLNGGGVISRTVAGQPDEYGEHGFLNLTKTFTPAMAAAEGLSDREQFQRWSNVTRKCWDFEPDQFVFNFNGYNGKFGFAWNTDDSKKITISSESKVKIEPIGMPAATANSYIQGWQVTDQDGIIYLFQTKELTRYQPIKGQYDDPNNLFNDCYDRPPTPSSWYLTEIRSPNGSWVKFTYSDYNLNYVLRISETQSPYITSDDPERIKIQLATIITNGKNLSKITTSSGNTTIDFVEDQGNIRTDLPVGSSLIPNNQVRLKEIVVKNLNLQEVKHTALYHNYETGRLTLNTLEDFPLDSNTPIKPPHRFTYNPIALPPFPSKTICLPVLGCVTTGVVGAYTQDHWGFYNNNTKETLIPSYTGTDYRDGSQYTIDGADRSLDIQRMQAGILTKIQYPTGGSTLFEYEPNSYGAIADQETPINEQMAGGLRIKQITNNDGETETMIRKFEYKVQDGRSSGVLAQLPEYGKWTWIVAPPFPGTQPVPIPVKIYSSTSFIPTALTRGTYIGYRKVTVYNGLNGVGGRTESEFTSFYDHNDDFYPDPDPDSDKLLSNMIPYPQPASIDYTRGLLTKQVDYTQQNVAVKKIENEYEIKEASIQGFKAGEFHPGKHTIDITDGYPAERVFKTSFYRFQLGSAKLKRSAETLYTTNGAFTTDKNYIYDADLQFLLKQTVKTSDQKELITEFTYPLSYATNSSTIELMKTRHILSPIIESVVKEKSADGIEKVIDASYNEMINYNNHILPYRTYKFESTIPVTDFRSSVSLSGNYDNRYYSKPLTTYNLYDNLDKPNQITTSGDVTSTYLWSSDGNLMAKVSNSTFASCAYTGFETNDFGNWQYGGSEPINWSTEARTGKRSFSGDLHSPPLTNQYAGYIVSLWAKGNGSIIVDGVAKTIDQTWRRYEWRINNGAPISFIYLKTQGNFIDDLRLHPVGSQMKTFTHEPLIGVSSVTDENNQITFYSYDGYGRLKSVRDNDGNIIKNYNYIYK